MTGTESLLKELSVEYGQVIIGGENLLKYLQQEYGSISIPNNSNRFIGDINTENEIYKTKVENVVTIPVPKYSNSYVNELKTVDSGKISQKNNSTYLDIKNKHEDNIDLATDSNGCLLQYNPWKTTPLPLKSKNQIIYFVVKATLYFEGLAIIKFADNLLIIFPLLTSLIKYI